MFKRLTVTLVILGMFGFVSPSRAAESARAVKVLEVPYISEAPDGRWVGPWKNACEEASLAMLEQFYRGRTEADMRSAKSLMQELFTYQNRKYGGNADSDAVRTAEMAQQKLSFNTLIKKNPSAQDIKDEIEAGHPVITFHYAKNMGNPNIPFVRNGSYYHVMVVTGYDDDKGEFITNDPGDRLAGKGRRYGYKVFMDSLHDFSHVRGRADGPSTIITTFPKLARVQDSHRVYFLDGEVRRYVQHPEVFTRMGWNWAAVNVVENIWLAAFKEGAVLERSVKLALK